MLQVSFFTKTHNTTLRKWKFTVVFPALSSFETWNVVSQTKLQAPNMFAKEKQRNVCSLYLNPDNIIVFKNQQEINLYF